jgi:hypothetical protein
VLVKLRQESSRAAAEGVLREVTADLRFRPWHERLPDLPQARRSPFDLYLVARAADRAAAIEHARRLRRSEAFDAAFAEGVASCPVQSADDPMSWRQGHLNAAPLGIDARWMWDFCDGRGIGFVDIENGWLLDHEDLAAANIQLVSGFDTGDKGHGTSVLGIVVGVDNDKGGIGIAPRAKARVVSPDRGNDAYDIAAAILAAAQVLGPGDVILIEQQISIEAAALVPVEMDPLVRDAIIAATAQGLLVVEAAGNGGHDLDLLQDDAGRTVLNRMSEAFRESGALLVGAATAAVPHRRHGFSNHGSRVDCYAWGDNIRTAGAGADDATRTAYVADFSGTSGASAIVAGAAVLLQSWRARFRQTFEPDMLRALLADPNHNTASATPAADRVGVMPNLRGIIEHLERHRGVRYVDERVVSLETVLWGLVDDSPGAFWIPGKRPVPVDPEWGWQLAAVPPATRDLLAMLLSYGLAQRVGDASSRAALSGAAVAAMLAAVKRIG